jgi:DNA invertase Pin-like site-specific DNA recombinase
MKRVGAYLRVSTQHQSTDLQRVELESYIRARGWVDIKFYEDQATGTNGNRPGLKSLMSDVRNRKIDIVISWKMCRLFRSLKDLVSTLEEFRQLGVDYISYKDQLDMSSPSGRLMTHLLGAFSEFEASLIKERVLAGLANAKRNGIKLGRPRQIDLETVLEYRRSGLSLSEVAERLKVTKGAVSKTLSKHELNNGLKNIENIELPKSKLEVE